MTVRRGEGLAWLYPCTSRSGLGIYPDPPVNGPRPVPAPAICVCLYIYAQFSRYFGHLFPANVAISLYLSPSVSGAACLSIHLILLVIELPKKAKSDR